MSKKAEKAVNKSSKKTTTEYLSLSNQQFLVRTLRLLGVTQSQFFKQTKQSLESQIFPKNVINPTSSKAFYFIIITCFKYLVCEQEYSQIKIWYPPRNLNEQLQFKKITFKLLQTLQIQGKVPKNLILTKGILMGDSSAGSILQFLRFLSELALRQLYIQKHSKRQSLIQIGVSNINYNDDSQKENDINRFYVFPFVPTKSTSEPPKVNIDNIKKILSKHIDIYKRKIIQLKTPQNEDLLNPQPLMTELIQQKQLAHTLSNKAPNEIFTQNRAFDRRRIMDKHNQIWKELKNMKCHFNTTDSVPILKLDGQIDKILNKWDIKTGIGKVYECNTLKKDFDQLKKQVKKRIEKFNEFKQKVMTKLSRNFNTKNNHNPKKQVQNIGNKKNLI